MSREQGCQASASTFLIISSRARSSLSGSVFADDALRAFRPRKQAMRSAFAPDGCT